MGEESVSVVIASNRTGRFLTEAVGSVRRQTVPVAEIVLVDDGSPGSALAELAEGLGLKYVRQPPSGVAAARNRGVGASTGSLLIFLDDDDIFHPERVAAQCEAMLANPNAVACYSGLWYLDGHGQRFGEPLRAPTGSATQMLSGEVDFPVFGTMMIRRDALIAVGGFHPAFRQAEDAELIFRLLQMGEFVGIDRELFGYRRYDMNVTTSHLAARTGGIRAITLQQWGAEARGDQALAGLIKQNLSRYRTAAGHGTGGDIVVSLRRGQWASAWEELHWGARFAPRATVSGVLRRTAQWVQNSRRRAK